MTDCCVGLATASCGRWRLVVATGREAYVAGGERRPLGVELTLPSAWLMI